MPLLYTEHSLDFDGTNDCVDMGDVPELSFERTDPFTWSFWAKYPTAAPDGVLMSKQLGGVPWQGIALFSFGSGLLVEFVSTNGSNYFQVRLESSGLDNNQWHHIVMTYDGTGQSGVSFYVDGELRTNITLLTNNLSATIITTATFRIGSRNTPTTSSQQGRITEAAVYDSELTPSEVMALYNAGNPPDLTSVGPTGNLVGYWRLGEHSYPTVPDLSASGNDGTMTNMAANDIVVDAPRPHESFYSLYYNSTGYVNIGNVAPLSFERTTAFSISAWVKFSKYIDAAANTILAKKQFNAPARGWILGYENTRIPYFVLTNTPSTNELIVTTVDPLVRGEWVHLVVTYDGSSSAAGVVFYVDGSPVSMNTTSDTLSATIVNSISAQIGASEANLFGEGAFGDIAVVQKVLSPTEVSAIYNGGRPADVRTLGFNSLLRGYWSANRSQFSTVPDLSMAQINGTAVTLTSSLIRLDAPGLDFISTEFGTLVTAFDGDGWVDMGDVLDFETTDPFSLCIFARLAPGVQSTLIAKEEGSGSFEGYFSGVTAAGHFFFRLEGAPGSNNKIEVQTAVGSFTDSNWHLFVVTYTGSTTAAGVALFVDGVSVPYSISFNALTNSSLNAAPFQIGNRDSNSSPLDGVVAWAAVYNKALTEVEVRTLYNERHSSNLLETMPLANLQGYWRFGNGDTFPVITDHSGNGYDGQMVRYLHQERLINDRPPSAAATQFANGLGGEAQVNEPALRFDRNDTFSFSCWFKTDSGAGQYPAIMGLLHENNSNETGILLLIEGFASWNPGSVAFMLAHDNPGNVEIYLNTNTTFNDGNWHHVVGTYDGSGVASGVDLFVDGVDVATTVRRNTLGANDFTSNGPFAIQDAANVGNATEGAVCQVAVYGKELSLAEAQTIYNAGTPPDLNSVGPTADLIAWWPILDTDLGTSALEDQGPNGYDMALLDTTASIQVGGPAPLEPLYSLEFDGINDYVSVGNVSPFQFDRLTTFSVVAWINLNLVSGDVAIFCKQNGSSVGYQVGVNASGYLFLIYTSVTTSNEIIVTADSPVLEGAGWKSVAVTYDGSSNANGVRMFVDGVEVPFSIVNNNLSGSLVNTSFLAIGARYIGSTNSHFNGNIDEVAAYNRALSPSEIFDLLGGVVPVDYGAVGPVDSLIGWWRMGDPGPSVYPTIADKAPAYNNPGTMTNMTSGDIVTDIPAYIYFSLIWAASSYPVPFIFDIQDVGTLSPFSYGTSQEDVDEVPSFKMRALADPGPGYVTWVVDQNPDFTGTEAPSAVQAGTVVLSSSWGLDGVQYLRVPTIGTIQNVATAATATDPGVGATLVLVDTADAAWNDLDTITLPAAPQNGAEVIVKDDAGNANVKKITVASADNIDGAPSRIIQTQRASLHVLFDGTEWRVI